MAIRQREIREGADREPPARPARTGRAFGSTRRIEAIAGVVALSLLLLGVVLVMRPFFTALLWSMVLVFSTWPLYARLTTWLGHSRSMAALLMTLALAAAFVFPLAVLSSTIAENATRAIDLVRGLLEQGAPAPPSWIVSLPVVGDEIARTWTGLARDSGQFTEFVRPYLAVLRGWAISSGLAVGAEVVVLTLAVVISFFLYRDGPLVAAQVQLIGQQLVGDRVQHLIQVAGATVRGVVYGILGTSLIQAALATVGYYVVGAPGALFLGFVTFFLAFVPSGPPLVWGPLTFWLFSQGEAGLGVFLLVWGIVVVGAVDHFLKPVLISRESKLPLLLIFFGVVGGALAFGVVGVFLGPVLLAVTFALIRDWTALIQQALPVEPPSASSRV